MNVKRSKVFVCSDGAHRYSIRWLDEEGEIGAALGENDYGTCLLDGFLRERDVPSDLCFLRNGQSNIDRVTELVLKFSGNRKLLDFWEELNADELARQSDGVYCDFDGFYWEVKPHAIKVAKRVRAMIREGPSELSAP